jgi:cytochrome P450
MSFNSGSEPLALDSKEIRSNPYPLYTMLRAKQPVFHYAPLNAWLISRHEDVQRLFIDRRVSAGGGRFSKGTRIFPAETQALAQRLQLTLSRMMLFQDLPDHTRIRRFVGKGLMTDVMIRVEESIDSVISELLTPLHLTQGDLVQGFAKPLPALVICRLLDIPEEDRDAVIDWVDDLAEFFVAAPPTEKQLLKAIESTAKAEDYFLDRCRHGKRSPEGGLLNLLMDYVDEDGDRLTFEEIASQCILFLFGGQETARSAIAVGAHRLFSNSDDRRFVLSGEAVAFTDELLRFESPVQWVARTSLDELEIAGTVIPAEQTLVLLIGSANRDESVFDSPDEFRPGRSRRSIAYGHGAHKCIGEHIGNLEIRRSFQALCSRFPLAQTLDTEPHWRPQLALRGLSQLLVDYGAPNLAKP